MDWEAILAIVAALISLIALIKSFRTDLRNRVVFRTEIIETDDGTKILKIFNDGYSTALLRGLEISRVNQTWKLQSFGEIEAHGNIGIRIDDEERRGLVISRGDKLHITWKPRFQSSYRTWSTEI